MCGAPSTCEAGPSSTISPVFIAATRSAKWRALADVLRDHPHVLVMTDDIYEHIRFGANGPAPHRLNAAPELKDRTFAINGVSKTYAMTGWRIGWAAGPRDIIDALGTLLSQASGNACSVSQAATVEALNGDQSFVAESVATYLVRRDRVLARVNAIPGLRCTALQGAFYLYVNGEPPIGRTAPDGRRLASGDDVALVRPGESSAQIGCSDRCQAPHATQKAMIVVCAPWDDQAVVPLSIGAVARDP